MIGDSPGTSYACSNEITGCPRQILSAGSPQVKSVGVIIGEPIIASHDLVNGERLLIFVGSTDRTLHDVLGSSHEKSG